VTETLSRVATTPRECENAADYMFFLRKKDGSFGWTSILRCREHSDGPAPSELEGFLERFS